MPLYGIPDRAAFDSVINMDYVKLSRHARRQIKWRRISKEQIEETVHAPDRVQDSIKGRKNAFKSVGEKLLKVTYRVENGDILIITAMVKGEKQ